MHSSVVLILLLYCLSLISYARAAHSEDWRRRSVYQLLTDRFARTNDSDNSACNVEDYCGGTYQGVINHLDWIQDMGFTAVWISPIQKGLEGPTPDGEDFHGKTQLISMSNK
jgi:alpha-amylase